jgi:hypothetical protein
VLYDFHGTGGLDENVFAYSNRCGEQRALVLYHNRDGRHFLRSGRELALRGLYAELGQYEFHLFLDFRRISDDPDRSWEGLHQALNGRGVENLDVERLQVRFAALNDSFARLLAEPLPLGEPAAEDATQPPTGNLSASLGQFLTALGKELSACGQAPRATSAEVAAELSLLVALLALKPASRDAWRFLSFMAGRLDTAPGARLLLTWMLLRGLPAATLDRFGLDHSLASRLPPDGVGDVGAGDRLQLLRALLEHGGTGWLGRVTMVERLFTIPACRRYLLVHESDGVVWFNRERFKELVAWLFICGLCAALSRRPTGRTLATWLGAAGRELSRLSELAAHTGYRVSLFTASCGGATAAPRGGRGTAPRQPRTPEKKN